VDSGWRFDSGPGYVCGMVALSGANGFGSGHTYVLLFKPCFVHYLTVCTSGARFGRRGTEGRISVRVLLRFGLTGNKLAGERVLLRRLYLVDIFIC